jgi:hypothetical protein
MCEWAWILALAADKDRPAPPGEGRAHFPGIEGIAIRAHEQVACKSNSVFLALALA